MKPRRSNQRNHALTRIEVLISVAVVFVLAGVAFLVFHRPKAVHRNVPPNSRSLEIQCVNNLKQINIAFRIWEGDNNDKMPMQVSAKKGGAMEPTARGNVATVFQVLSNQLWTPKVLICPVDANHIVAKNFTVGFDKSSLGEKYYSTVAGVTDTIKPGIVLQNKFIQESLGIESHFR